MACIGNYIQPFHSDVIIYPCTNFIGGLVIPCDVRLPIYFRVVLLALNET